MVVIKQATLCFSIQQWVREGNLAKLDQLVLSGCGDLLLDKKSNNTETGLFLQELPNLLVRPASHA